MVNRPGKIKRYARELSAEIRSEDRHIRNLLSDDSILTQLFLSTKLKVSSEEFISFRESLTHKKFETFLFDRSKPVFWSTQETLPPESIWKTTADGIIRQYVKLPAGDFLSYKKGLWVSNFGSVKAVVLLPISYVNKGGNRMETIFPLHPDIPPNIQNGSIVSPNPLGLANQKPFSYLFSTDTASLPDFPIGLSLLVFILLISICYTIRHYSRIWRSEYGFIIGGFLLFVTFLILSYLIEQSGISVLILSHLPWLNPWLVQNKISGSVVNQLLDTGFLLWLSIYFTQEQSVASSKHISSKRKLYVGFGNYFGLLVVILVICKICQSLINKPDQHFDFDNVFYLDITGLLVLLQIVFLIFSVFLLCQRLSLNIAHLQMPLLFRVGLLSAAFILLLPYIRYSGLNLPLIPLILSIFILIVLFELFAESEKPNFSWMIIWLVVFAGFSSIMIYKFNLDQETLNRLKIVKQLANPNDSLMISAVDNTIQAAALKYYSRQNLDPKQYEILSRQIAGKLAANSYLKQFYIIKTIPLPNKEFRSVYFQEKEIYSLAQSNLFRYWVDDSLPHHIIGEIPIAGNEGSIAIEIQRNKLDLSQIPAFQGMAPAFKGISQLRNYSYAIYIDGQIEESNGPDFQQTIADAPQLQVGEMVEQFEEKKAMLYYQVGPGFLLILTRNLIGLSKPLSLFSYLFIFLVFSVGVLLLFNRFVPFLPVVIRNYLQGSITLRNKIQLSFLALILFSFIVIGSVTVFYFRNAAERNQKNNLRNKAFSVLSDVQSQIARPDSGEILATNLQPVLKTLAAIHQTPVEIYSVSGQLMAASDDRLIDPINRSGMISPLPYWEMMYSRKNYLLNDDEKLGSIKFQAAYAAILDNRSQMVAILSLPNYQPEQDRNILISDFMSTLLNVYVFLLLIAGAIALFIANSITKPIADLGEKLRRFKLGKRNEPLEWKNKDELGVLINEYNQMISKLEKSAEVMAQNEREGAWREMAKQVAHEIKNPLT
ncbi:MAG: hypothetical protein ABIV51_14370, partial [Saprospiraceae bacterium]